MAKIDLKTIEKYGSKDIYFFKTNQNVFIVRYNVFNKCRKLVELVEEIDGVKLVTVTDDCGKWNTMFLEFDNDDSIIQVYVNSRNITVGNHFSNNYFDMGLKVGSTHIDEVVDFIKKYFTK